MILQSKLLSAIPGVRHGFSTRLTDVASTIEGVVRVKQVHGARVVEARETAGAEADGIYSTSKGSAMGINTADCVPVLIACTKGQGVAAVHAGWRGAVAGIVEVALENLERKGIAREDLRFALGPSIGLEAFEVGDEVIEAARASLGATPPAVRWDSTGKYHLDLRGLLITQLARWGIPREHIELTGGCTVIESGLYHSYRRDRSGGRQLSAIALEP
jgi:YfiH family protein